MLLELADEDGIALADDPQTVFGDHTGAAHRKTRTGKWMTMQNVVRNSQRSTQRADLVLEELRQRLEHLALCLQFENAVDAVVVGLDLRGLRARVRCAFNDIRIKRPLREHFRVTDRIPKDIDEQVANDHALFLRIIDAIKRRHETLGAINSFDRHTHAVEIVANLLALIFAHQAVIDKNRADVGTRLVQKNRKHRAINATGDTTHDLLVADLFTNTLDDLALEVINPERQQTLCVEQEIVKDPQTLVTVGHLRVKLDAEKPVVPLQRNRRSVLIRRQHLGAIRQDLDGIRMAHPHLRGTGNSLIQTLALGGKKIGRTILATVAGLDGSAELDVEQLHAVANTEHRHPKGLECFKIQIRRVDLAGALRPARKNDRSRLSDLGKILNRVKFCEKTQLPHPPHNELRVLRTKIYNRHMVAVVHRNINGMCVEISGPTINRSADSWLALR